MPVRGNLSEPAASDILLTTVTDYVGNRIYVNNTLKYILTEEGYIEKTGSTYSYFYYLKDRLGGIRIVMNAAGGVVQANNYYPSGVTIAELPRRTDQGVQRYKFGGKELDRSYGLDAYDFEARPYNPVLMRFTGFDPLASKYPAISPFAYCLNNPVKYTDPDGKLPVLLIPIIKGAVGAVVDAAAQVTVSMANGQSFGEAMSNIDYTSVGASFVTSALTMPGMSTGTKVATVAAVAIDAAVDINSKDGFRSVATGEKSLTNVAIDAAASVLPGKAVDGLTSGFNKAVTSDLTASSVSTMTKETKLGLKYIEATANSTAVQTGANAVADYTGKITGGQANKSIATASTVSIPAKDPTVQQRDATRVQQPIYPIRPR